jgi:nucleotidyltransferase/DNA polymerase involved in DNA repair
MQAKAGMPSMASKAGRRVAQIVQHASAGSTAFNARKADLNAVRDARSARIASAADQLSDSEVIAASSAAASFISRLEARNAADTKAGPGGESFYILLDLDAFFAAVEVLDDPSLTDVAFAVGGEVGVLCTSSYMARKFGVRAGMGTHIAKALLPSLRIIHPRIERYAEISKVVMAEIRKVDPDAQTLSLDEALMNVTPLVTGPTPAQALAQAGEIAAQLRRRVYAVSGLTASCGVASNPTVAKLLADKNKPNGQALDCPTRETARRFLLDLDVRRIPFIGAVTEKFLNAPPFCATTVGSLLEDPRRLGLLYILLTPGSAQGLLSRFLGLADRLPSFGGPSVHSVGAERTFRAVEALPSLAAILREVCELAVDAAVAKQLPGHPLAGLLTDPGTLHAVLKLKTSDFVVMSHAVRVPAATFVGGDKSDIVEVVFAAALQALEHLLERAEGSRAVRLLGMRLSRVPNDVPLGTQNTISHALIAQARREPGPFPQADRRTTTAGAADATGPGAPTSSSSPATDLVCPLCGQSFVVFSVLEAHAAECNAGSASAGTGPRASPLAAGKTRRKQSCKPNRGSRSAKPNADLLRYFAAPAKLTAASGTVGVKAERALKNG